MPQVTVTTVNSLIMQPFADLTSGQDQAEHLPTRDAPKYLGLAALSKEVEVQMVTTPKPKQYMPKMYRPDMAIAQPIIDQFVPKQSQAHLRERIEQSTGSERFEKVFLSQKMLNFNLDGVKDQDIKNKLIFALQSSPFTLIAVEGATKLVTQVGKQYPTAEFMMRLTKIDDQTAKDVLQTESDMREAYLRKVGQAIAVASPESRGLIVSQMQTTTEVPQAALVTQLAAA